MCAPSVFIPTTTPCAEAASSKPHFILRGDWKTIRGKEYTARSLFCYLPSAQVPWSLQTNGQVLITNSEVTSQKTNFGGKIKSLAVGREALHVKYLVRSGLLLSSNKHWWVLPSTRSLISSSLGWTFTLCGRLTRCCLSPPQPYQIPSLG